jgi:transposase
MRHTLRSLARRWLELHDEIKTHTGHLKALTLAAAPDLVAVFGVGFDSAAELLITAGDNTDRVGSEAAYAKLCGACPIPAGSGKTNGRHRLNRGGNGQANASLYRITATVTRPPRPTRPHNPRDRPTGRRSSRLSSRCQGCRPGR